MKNVYRESMGYKPKKVLDGFPNQEHARFAKQIRLTDIWNAMGGKEKVPADMRNTIANMFSHIAGDDGIIQENELKGFFKKLEKASGDDKMLNSGEAYKLSHERGEVEARSNFLIFDSYDKNLEELPAKFIKALYNANKSKLALEDKQTAISANTTVDKNGNSTYREKVNMEHNGKKIVERRTTKDKAGNVTRVEYYTADNEMQAEVLKNGEVVQQIRKTKDGSIYTDTIKNWAVIKSDIKTPDGYWSETNYYFDEKGNPTKSVTKTSDGDTFTEYSDRWVLKHKDGSTTTKYIDDNGYGVTKEVKKSKSGKIVSSVEYKNNKEGNCILETQKDGSGKVQFTISHSYDSKGNETKSVTKDANGQVTFEEFFKNGKEVKSVSYNPEGSEIVLYKANGTDIKQQINKDLNGNVISITNYSYDAKGREAKKVTKNANGNIINTTSFEYPKKNMTRAITRDVFGSIIQISEDKMQGGMKTEYYRDGKILCSKEEFKQNSNGKLITTYKDGLGKEISQNEFLNIRLNIRKASPHKI